MTTMIRFLGGPADGGEIEQPETPDGKPVAQLCMGVNPPRDHYVRSALAADAYAYVGHCDDQCPGGVGWDEWNRTHGDV